MANRAGRCRVVAAVLPLLLAGCGGGPPAPPVALGPSAVPNMVGEWHLESYGGQALPAGITVTYGPDGEVAVDGNAPPAVDRGRLKRAMDEFGRGWAGTPNTVAVSQSTTTPGQPPDVFEFKLRRK